MVQEKFTHKLTGERLRRFNRRRNVGLILGVIFGIVGFLLFNTSYFNKFMLALLIAVVLNAIYLIATKQTRYQMYKQELAENKSRLTKH